MAYSVPPLPYAYDALEPHIDKATMEFHHDKHHQAYVDKANAALEGTEWADKPVEEVLKNLDSLGEKKGTREKQRRRPLQPHAVLGEHAPGRRRRAERRAGARRSTRRSAPSRTSRRRSRKPASTSSARAGRGSCTTARAWRSSASANQDSPISDGKTPLLGRRRVGARLLPEVPEPPPRLHRRVVERRRLGQGRRALLRRLRPRRTRGSVWRRRRRECATGSSEIGQHGEHRGRRLAALSCG